MMALSKIDSDGIVSGGITADSLNIGQIGGRRNLIINGAMQVAQRGASFANAYGYTLDRWNSQYNNTSARSTVTQETSGGPAEFRSFLRVTVTTADATVDSSDLQNIKQAIEGYNMQHTDQGTSDAKTLTCSFWVRSSVTGTYSVTLYLNSNGTVYSYPVEYTVNTANTWEYKTVTFSPQTTSASWVSSGYTNGEYAQLRFGLMIGSGQGGTADTWNASNKFGASGQTNLFATNGATWDLTGVQLEVGSVATPFEHRSFGEEMELCRRYYFRLINAANEVYGQGFNYGAYVRTAIHPQTTEFRTLPSLEYVGPTTFYRKGTNATNNVNTTGNPWEIVASNKNTIFMQSTISDTSEDGVAGSLYLTGSGCHVSFNAEL
jgi:hypothetical protein